MLLGFVINYGLSTILDGILWEEGELGTKK